MNVMKMNKERKRQENMMKQIEDRLKVNNFHDYESVDNLFDKEV